MNKTTDTILITGATGNQGSQVARQLLANGYKVRAMTRKPDGDAAKGLAAKGAQIVAGDLDDKASLERALDGAWGVFAVQNTWEAGVEKEEEQGKRIAELAKKKGVQHFVYTSVGSAHRNTGIPHFDNKYRVEQAVKALNFPSWTILRPAFFFENWMSPWFKPGLADGKVMIGMKPSTRLQMISTLDIGRFGAMAFEDHAHMNGRCVDISGDALTGPEMAAVFTKLAGRKFDFVQLPIEAVRQGSADFATMLEWFDAHGYDAPIAALEADYHVRFTRFEEWAAVAQPWR